jgi:hypothetical protein
MQEHQVGTRRRRRWGQPLAAQTVFAESFRQAVTQGLGKQLADSFQGVLFAGDRVAAVVKVRGYGLAGRVTIQSGYRRRDVTAQPGALEQALGIDCQIIARRFEAVFKRRPLAAAQRLPRVLTPASEGHWDHPGDGRMPAGNLGKGFLHQPVEANAGNCPGGIGEGGQAVNHIAQ